jgi:hypothetical protein
MSHLFDTKELRWAIYSFVDNTEETKKKLNCVLQELLTKHVFNTQVLPRIIPGTRKVVRDNNGVCINCYHYGPYEIAGSVNGKCMNHVYNEPSGQEDYWLTFEEFCEGTHPDLRFQTYEEYVIECKIIFSRRRL